MTQDTPDIAVIRILDTNWSTQRNPITYSGLVSTIAVRERPAHQSYNLTSVFDLTFGLLCLSVKPPRDNQIGANIDILEETKSFDLRGAFSLS